MHRGYGISERRVCEQSDAICPITVYVNPDEDEKRYLIDVLKVDEHTLNSALDPDEPSRLEFEPEHAAIIFKMPKNQVEKDELLFKVASLGVFLFKDRLVIIISEEIPLFEHKQLSKVLSINDLMLKLFYRSIFRFLENLKVMNTLSDEIEDKINVSMENRYLINLFTLEKSMVYYLNAINSNGVLLEKLRNNAAKIGFLKEESELLDDIIVENTQCYRQAEIYSNILASLMDARVSIVSNNLNILMKTLTIITICIMAPTLVVSMFSMNVHIPLEDHPVAFWIIIGLAFIAGAGFLLFWKYKKW